MSLKLATFKVDVTCPVGHPLTAGWKEPAVACADPLYAVGIVLFGPEKPVVLCAVDWCEISNESHMMWRTQLAAACNTDADHVAVQTTHPHCTPWPDEEAQRLVSQHAGLRHVMQPDFCHAALKRVAAAIREAVTAARSLTHITTGQARIEHLASNRRVMGDDGKVKAVRWTVTKDPEVRKAPEGLIDPWLKTIGFWDGDEKVAAAHYYAVHNTSYDDDLIITNDFLGLARERRAAEEPRVTHIFFNGCAGNITAGKYNNGDHGNREVFTRRIHAGIIAAETTAKRVAVNTFRWHVTPVFLPPGTDMNEPDMQAILSDPAAPEKFRIKAAIKLAGLRRQGIPIPIGCLKFEDLAHVVHLPGESFIEYQLFAQEQSSADWVAVPSYGDCGPGYICMDRSYAEGGYEPTDSFVSPGVESVMKDAISKIL